MITLYMVNVCLTVYVIEEQSQSVAADLLACMSVFVCVHSQSTSTLVSLKKVTCDVGRNEIYISRYLDREP